MNTSADYRQREIKNDNSLVEILAILIIGGISMFMAALGILLDNIFLLIMGCVLVVLSVGTAATKFISGILDIRDRFKKKDK